MKRKGKSAIILGATGLTGSLLLQKLLVDDRYDWIKVFTRKPIGVKHPKLIELPANMLELEKCKDDFVGDEVYCCIGTTAKKTPDKKIYRKIDFGIPVAAARLCAENKISTFIVISSIGANAKSNVFYSRTKGEMEMKVLNQEIKNTYILQPSFVVGDRNENRAGEKFGIVLAKFIKPIMIGPMKKYRAIQADTIANAMIYLANHSLKNVVIPSDEIQLFGSL